MLVIHHLSLPLTTSSQTQILTLYHSKLFVHQIVAVFHVDTLATYLATLPLGFLEP